MPFNASAFRQWVQEHNSKDGEDEFQKTVLQEIADEDYPLAAYQLNRCRLPVGLTGLAECLDGAIDEGMSKLFRVWRYLAFRLHIDQTEAEWIQEQKDAGQTPEYEMPTINMEFGCYALAGAIAFEERGFARWAGERLLASYADPDLRPVNLDGGAMIPYSLSLFLYWLASQGDNARPNVDELLSNLKSKCHAPYKKVLAGWGDEQKYRVGFHALCDDYGDTSSQPIPFNGFPVLILATQKIRQDLNLAVAEHPLLDQPICRLAEATIDRRDPFFTEVDRQIVEIAPTAAFQWPW